jgi:hypothetical protein
MVVNAPLGKTYKKSRAPPAPIPAHTAASFPLGAVSFTVKLLAEMLTTYSILAF